MPYSDIVAHYENCYRKYGDNHKGVDWPVEADALRRYQVMLEMISFDTYKKEYPSVLDFGCGLGHMYEYIKKENVKVNYAGLDMSELFIRSCREKYPERDFYRMDLLAEDNGEPGKYDYIIMNGVFTEKRELSYDEMLLYFQKLIRKAYNYCIHELAFNVMSKDVDWEREDLFHLPLNTLSQFLTKEITRDFIIRYDYGLYEYAVYVYKGRKN